MKAPSWLILFGAAALTAAGCGGAADVAATTTASPTTLAPPITSIDVTTTADLPPVTLADTATTAVQTTTTAADDTTATTAAPVIPATIAAGAFNFAAGTSPRFAILVAISTDGPGGPFVGAGAAPGPPIPADSEFWVQFTIDNLASLTTMTDLSVVLPDLGSDNLCPLPASLLPFESTICVSPGFTAVAGQQSLAIAAEASGFRQGEVFERVINPPIVAGHQFAGVAHSFTFAVELSELDGITLAGAASEGLVDVALPEVSFSAPVAVDCSDTFASGFSDGAGSPQPGEPRIVAFSITNFTDAGEVASTCERIPKFDLDYLPDDASEDAVHYEGQ